MSLVLLDDQDRSLWNQEQIAEGSALVERALLSRRFGPYTIQAALAAVHAEAPHAAATGWAQIVRTVRCAVAEPSPVVELSRAVAVAMRDGPAAGLALIDAILARGELRDCHLLGAGRPAAGENSEPAPPTNALLASRGRSRSGGFSSDGWASCRAERAPAASAIRMVASRYPACQAGSVRRAPRLFGRCTSEGIVAQ